MTSTSESSNNSDYVLSYFSDTILTLKNPNVAPAVWDEPDKEREPDSVRSSQSEVTFRVCSKSLMQASTVFAAALLGGWKEASTAEDGCFAISTENWDSEAMLIVLSAIHSRTKDIPRKVTLEMLCKIAVLVDYYELQDALQFYGSLWIDYLRSSLPATYGRDIVLWICVSSIFRNATSFCAATKVAIESSPEDVRTLDLPISASIISRLNVRREEALRRVFKLLDGVKSDLLTGTAGCSFECRSILLGALVKHMCDEGLDDAVPRFEDRSFTDIAKKIRDIKSPDRVWHKPSFPYSSCSFSLSDLTKDRLNEITTGLRGLKLDDHELRSSQLRLKSKKNEKKGRV